MDKTPTSTDSDGRITRRERIFVFAGPGIAALCAGISLPLGGGVEFLQLCALVGIVWMALASLACALWRGSARGDWSSFRRPELKDTGHRATRGERAFALAGFGIAVLYTAVSLALGAGMEHVASLWIAGVVWLVLAGPVCGLWRGIVRGDWSAFHPRRRDDSHDWLDDRRASWHFDLDTRTGSYSYLRDWEDRHLHDNDHLR